MRDIDEPIGGLSQGEALLLRTLRRLALHDPCMGVKAQLENALGLAGDDAYGGLVAFMAHLRSTGRRRIEIGAPPTPRLTDDERLILEAFAAAQDDDYRTLDTKLSLLLDSRPSATLGGAACLVAQVFLLQGLPLRADLSEDEDPKPPAAEPDHQPTTGGHLSWLASLERLGTAALYAYPFG